MCVVKAIRITIQNDSTTLEARYLIKPQNCHVLLGLSLPRYNLVPLMIQFFFYYETVSWKRGYACSGRVQHCNEMKRVVELHILFRRRLRMHPS